MNERILSRRLRESWRPFFPDAVGMTGVVV
jgi:hypothetical protein